MFLYRLMIGTEEIEVNASSDNDAIEVSIRLLIQAGYGIRVCSGDWEDDSLKFWTDEETGVNDKDEQNHIAVLSVVSPIHR